MLNWAYMYQNRTVMYNLVINHGYSLEQAAELWYNSKTRHVIQEEEQADWVSPARCVEELLMEVTNNPMWNVGIY